MKPKLLDYHFSRNYIYVIFILGILPISQTSVLNGKATLFDHSKQIDQGSASDPLIDLALRSPSNFKDLIEIPRSKNATNEIYENYEPKKFYSEVPGDISIRTYEDTNEAKGNCTERSIHDFPADLFTKEQRQQGAVLLHTCFGFYCFLLTAYVCNDYLLPSLDCICSGMKISADVAGATFLATASCFPELFVSIVGTFLTESDLGVGAVMGGAVFNTFATPACGALTAIQGIPLEWKILSRDCVLYVISVGVLVVVMWDGLIVWYEAAIFMLLFVGYLILLFCSKAISRWWTKLTHLCKRSSGRMKANIVQSEEIQTVDGLYKPYVHNELIVEYRKSICKAASRKPTPSTIEQQKVIEEVTMEDLVLEDPGTPFTWPKGSRTRKAWFLFTWPLKFVLFITIPDCRFKRLRRLYPLTFIMCVIWVAVSSYLVSWMMTVVGDAIGIADSIMGITFLSAGGNMPELVSIVILSRQGNGDMAMSNTLGANTLDILLCLGLPWIIKTAMTGKDVEIVSGALSYSVLAIIPCVILFYLVTAFCKFHLNKKVGIICLLLYVIFLVFAILIELNVFFFVNLPMCDT